MTDAMALLTQEFSALSTAVSWLQQGVYHYQLNGQPTDILEPWRRGIDAKGQSVIQSLRYSQQHQMLLRVHWQQLPGQHSQSAKISWQQGAAEPISACYRLSNRRWHYQSGNRQLNGEQAAPWHFYPLLRVFSGRMVLAMQQEQPVLLPNIELAAAEQRLQPLWHRRRSFCVNRSEMLHTYVMQGGHYRPDNAYFMLDQSGLLQRYHWQQSAALCWDIQLELMLTPD